MSAAQHQPARVERSHRDNSPEQIEAMQHVARECSELDSKLGGIAPHRLHRRPMPEPALRGGAPALYIATFVVALVSGAGWLIFVATGWVAPHVFRWLS